MVKKTLLLVTVSVMGIIKVRISIRPQTFSGIINESVYTTLLLQDNSIIKHVNIKKDENLFIPFIIESSVFSFFWIPAKLIFIVRRIKPGKAVIL